MHVPVGGRRAACMRDVGCEARVSYVSLGIKLKICQLAARAKTVGVEC